MKNVRILNEESEGTGTAKVDVVLDGGKTLTVYNCHLVSKVYFGTVAVNDKDNTVKYKPVFLSMDENNDGLITLDEI